MPTTSAEMYLMQAALALLTPEQAEAMAGDRDALAVWLNDNRAAVVEKARAMQADFVAFLSGESEAAQEAKRLISRRVWVSLKKRALDEEKARLDADLVREEAMESARAGMPSLEV